MVTPETLMLLFPPSHPHSPYCAWLLFCALNISVAAPSRFKTHKARKSTRPKYTHAPWPTAQMACLPAAPPPPRACGAAPCTRTACARTSPWAQMRARPGAVHRSPALRAPHAQGEALACVCARWLYNCGAGAGSCKCNSCFGHMNEGTPRGSAQKLSTASTRCART
eukprot:scaffold26645_cov21-Tisochrysis_lutea.AAC.3